MISFWHLSHFRRNFFVIEIEILSVDWHYNAWSCSLQVWDLGAVIFKGPIMLGGGPSLTIRAPWGLIIVLCGLICHIWPGGGPFGLAGVLSRPPGFYLAS